MYIYTNTIVDPNSAADLQNRAAKTQATHCRADRPGPLFGSTHSPSYEKERARAGGEIRFGEPQRKPNTPFV